jgi:putative Mn2+ efflux pump MntP
MEASRKRIFSLVLKAVAVGMSVASIVMGFLPDTADVNTQITLLGIGLFALAVDALQKEEDQLEDKE